MLHLESFFYFLKDICNQKQKNYVIIVSFQNESILYYEKIFFAFLMYNVH
jgi:hypothetical protein